jgi:8-oxo-(d)GTP phosphatase
MSQEVIRASGGVVVRPSGDGSVEVLIIHRPHYDDWSLPKGKDDRGETAEQAALRELHEETGYRARIVAKLGDQHYTVGNGRPKIVAYFIMRPTTFDGFDKGDEVDVTRWVDLETAAEMLSYDHDRQLLDDPRIAHAARSGTVFLVRHAHAGDRSTWDGDDRLRPITKKGRTQSKAIATGLARRGVGAIHSSPYVRCVQTVEPLAKLSKLPIIENDLLGEGSDTSKLIGFLAANAGTDLVLCSHGDVIPELLDRLARRGMELRSPTGTFECRKASTWEIEIDGGVPVTARYIPPPS